MVKKENDSDISLVKEYYDIATQSNPSPINSHSRTVKYY